MITALSLILIGAAFLAGYKMGGDAAHAHIGGAWPKVSEIHNRTLTFARKEHAALMDEIGKLTRQRDELRERLYQYEGDVDGR